MIKGALEDKFLNEEIDKLVKNHNIETIVETGIYKGWSTSIFAKKVKKVIGIDISDSLINEAKKYNAENKNVDFYLGSSPEVLNSVLKKNDNSILFFLDAHWGEYWPLLDELKVIKEKKILPVIVIHDFFVPDEKGNAKFGFDKYGDTVLNFEYVKSSMDKIYGKAGYVHYCLDEIKEVDAGCGFFIPNR